MIIDTLIFPSIWGAIDTEGCIRPNPLEGRCEFWPDSSMNITAKQDLRCYPNAMHCCESPEMKYFIPTPRCLINSRDFGYLTCDDAVSINIPATNEACRNLCTILARSDINPTTDGTWAASCRLESFKKVNDSVVPGGSCFSNWVYGHSDPSSYSEPPQVYDGVKTPSLCQALCQGAEECVSFQWTPNQRSYWAYRDPIPRCILKNKEQIQGAIESSSGNVDDRYCYKEIPELCEAGLLPCLTCDQKMSCVWHSKDYISGWKYCDDKPNVCDPVSVTTTLAPGVETVPTMIGMGIPFTVPLRWREKSTNQSGKIRLDQIRAEKQDALSISGESEAAPIGNPNEKPEDRSDPIFAEDPDAEWISEEAKLDWIRGTQEDRDYTGEPQGLSKQNDKEVSEPS